MRQLVRDSFVRFSTGLLSSLFYRFLSEGCQQLPEKGGVLLLCNHVSYIDTFFILRSCPRPVRFLIYEPIYRVWYLKPFIDLIQPIAIPSEGKTRRVKQSLFEVISALSEGDVVCIFPEGGLTRDGTVQKFQRGVSLVIEAAQVPVVPLGLSGLWGSIFSYAGGRLFSHFPRTFRPNVELRVGEPIKDKPSLEELREEILKLTT